MTYEINGSNGVYKATEIKDDSTRYGMNAAANHKLMAISPIMDALESEAPILDFSTSDKAADNNIKAMEKFARDNDSYLNSLPPLKYEYRYMPNIKDSQIDKNALYGAAREELGAENIGVDDFEKNYLSKDMTVKPLDINNDGKIDIPEYSTNILAADMLSKENPSIDKIDGVINDKGLNAVSAYAKKSNAEAATKLYSGIYNHYSLG